MSRSVANSSTSVEPGSKASISFIPQPQVTFLFEEPVLICQLCQETELRLRKKTTVCDDTTPAILPCGHVLGVDCWKQWAAVVDQNNEATGEDKPRTCPFCRIALKYSHCKHPLPPKLVDRVSLLSIPATIVEGGSIPSQCKDCRISTSRSNNYMLLEELKPGYTKAKANYERTGSLKDKKVFDWNKDLLQKLDKVFNDKLIEDLVGW